MEADMEAMGNIQGEHGLNAWREGVVERLARKGNGKGNGADGGSLSEGDTARALAILEEHVANLAYSTRQLFVATCTLFEVVRKGEERYSRATREVQQARKELEKARRALEEALENASPRTPWPWLIAGALGGLLGGLAVGFALAALL